MKRGSNPKLNLAYKLRLKLKIYNLKNIGENVNSKKLINSSDILVSRYIVMRQLKQ